MWRYIQHHEIIWVHVATPPPASLATPCPLPSLATPLPIEIVILYQCELRQYFVRLYCLVMHDGSAIVCYLMNHHSNSRASRTHGHSVKDWLPLAAWWYHYWNIMEQYETIWNSMKRYRTTWTVWNNMEWCRTALGGSSKNLPKVLVLVCWELNLGLKRPAQWWENCVGLSKLTKLIISLKVIF